MTSQVAPNRRTTLPQMKQKRRKPRRQSGVAVQFDTKETVVERTRVERTDSDKVIRRNSMERKMSVRNSIKLPLDFLNGVKGLDDSMTRMSMSHSVRGLHHSDPTDSSLEHSENNSDHGPTFTEAQLEEMSKQALELSESGSEELSIGLDEKLDDL